MFENPSPIRIALVVATVVAAATLAPTAAALDGSTSVSPSASFSPSVVYEHRGDVANVTVDTSDGGIVNIGSPSAAFWMQVRVGGGTTKLRLNTYAAGLADTEAELKRALSGGTVVYARPTPVDRPLEAARYDLNVTRSDRELTVGKLVLEERSTHGVDVRIAPGATSFDELSAPGEITAATQVPWGNGSVARGDWAVVRVNATGLSGMISKARLDDDGDDVELVFEQTNGPMNADPKEFTGDEVERFVPVERGFYAFVDTAEHDIAAGERYNVSFAVDADSGLTKKREIVSASFEVVPRRISVERTGPGDAIVVEGKTTITGTTSLTPGSTINITARDDAIPPFHRPRTVTVSPDRTFAATFDFSNLEPGREFDFRFPDQGTTIPGAVKTIETTTTETTVETTTTTRTTTTETTAETTTTTRTTTTKTTADGLTQMAVDGTAAPLTQQALENGTNSNTGDGAIPGFGPVTAVAAAVAAIALAVRRR